MFKEYKELLSIENVLKDAYNYEFNGNMKELLQKDFVELEGNGVDALMWFNYEGERYLFKPLKDAKINVWGEILSSYLAEYLDIPHAEYRIASFNGQLGVVTKSIIKGKEKLVLGAELFQEFMNQYPYKNKKEILIKNKLFRYLYDIPDDFLKLKAYDRKRYLFNYLNNLDCIQSIVFNFNEIERTDKTRIIEGLRKNLIFDIITMQYDRHPNNWGIIANKNVRYSPLFDNSTSFGLNYPNMEEHIMEFNRNMMTYYKDALIRGLDPEENRKDILYRAFPTLVVDTEDSIDPMKKIKKKIPEVLEHYLRISDKEDNEIAIQMISSVSSNLIEKLIRQAEAENYMEMDSTTFNYILTLFDNHLEILQSIIETYRRKQDGVTRSK